MTLRLSVVIPALDEASVLTRTLAALSPLRRDGHEVIVADGGSRDDTVAIAQGLADGVVAAPRGRAAQMNAGAAAAHGGVLVFLHADTELPPDAAAAIAGAVAAGAQWGRFDVVIEGHSHLLPLVAAAMNLRSRITGITTGDQALFATRDAFARAGGFPLLPLMEDIALSATLKRIAGRPACLRQRVVTSGRRWDRQGALRTIATMWRLRFDYWRGVEPAELARRYAMDPPRPAPVLQIFAKDPLPGFVKTRLAAAIGATAAADAYRELAERTLATAVAARAAGVVGSVELWCDPAIDAPALAGWAQRYGLTLQRQQGTTLGDRMHCALSQALAQGTPALLIGTDCPSLDVAYLADAATALATNDAVFGPAQDGGYVLVGLSRDIDVFSDVPWSTEHVMAATRARLAAAKRTWRELPTLWDIDTAADLERFRAGAAMDTVAVART